MKQWVWACLGLLFCATLVLAMHGNWQDHYTTASGITCCGPRDCVRVTARLLRPLEENMVEVEIDGLPHQLPQGSLHLSEDHSDWACWGMRGNDLPVLRCVFLAIGT